MGEGRLETHIWESAALRSRQTQKPGGVTHAEPWSFPDIKKSLPQKKLPLRQGGNLGKELGVWDGSNILVLDLDGNYVGVCF